jgi:shikimate kinase
MKQRTASSNIILVGFMGTGKTTVGRALAERLKRRHLDLDEAIITHEGCSIAQVFEQKGEAYFRDLETSLLHELLKGQNQVLTTGGGAVLRAENVRAMLDGGTVIALAASEEELIRRLSADTQRPLLAGGVAERIKKLLRERAGAYDFAHIQIDTTGKKVDAIVAEIMKRMVEIGAFGGD